MLNSLIHLSNKLDNPTTTMSGAAHIVNNYRHAGQNQKIINKFVHQPKENIAANIIAKRMETISKFKPNVEDNIGEAMYQFSCNISGPNKGRFGFNVVREINNTTQAISKRLKENLNTLKEHFGEL